MHLLLRSLLLVLVGVGFAGSNATAAPAQSPEEVVQAIVNIYAEVPTEARTAKSLGRQRRGTGIVVDNNGLVLTVGYLILEASAVDVFAENGARYPADVVAYDHESGLGLIRTRDPLDVSPVRLGSASGLDVGEPLLVMSREGSLRGAQVKLADRREFAGYWEYLLDGALFTSPPHLQFAGAALIDENFELVGVGSLAIRNAAGVGVRSPGNMFIPVDELLPIMGELLAAGKRDAAERPWLGVYIRSFGNRILVQSVAEDGPAEEAGLQPGDQIVGIASQPVSNLADFYRKLWSLGEPGVDVALQVRRRNRPIGLDVRSANRYDWLRFQHSY